MRKSIAKISLVVALVLFFSGFLVLCSCPGWYALAAGFAGVTVWLGERRMRAWGLLWVVASLALTAVHAYAKVREAESVREIRQRYERKQRQDTNHITPPNLCCSECAGRVSVTIRSSRWRIAERFR